MGPSRWSRISLISGVKRFVDKNNKIPRPPLPGESVNSSELEEIYRRLNPEMRRPKPSPEAVAAALESAQRLAAEVDAEDSAHDLAADLGADAAPLMCPVCGYRNREGTKFCGMCGGGIESESAASTALAHSPSPAERAPRQTQATGNETHHYHHHYHHHYFPGAPDASAPRGGHEPAREPLREDKLRPSTAALRGDMSRAEAAVRRVTQEWVLACNTKHLDDLLDLYVSDAIVLRSNHPPIRGAAAVREFFFGLLDAGFGEVEVEPLRVDVVGDFAYEAGRCKALVPSASGKRREERGKCLWVCARQSNGEWKLAADCWSSDLSLTTLESDVPQGSPVRTRKNS